MTIALIKPFVIVVLFLGLIAKGKAQCTLDDFTIGTVRTHRVVQGKTEWNVTVINTCACPVKQIWLNCKGFQTVERVDPKILLKNGDRCLLINGDTLPRLGSVNFSYAWDPPFLLTPASTVTTGCSEKFL